MTPQDADMLARATVHNLLTDPLYLFFLLLIPAVGAYAGNYLSEKGKNRATKEDIKTITETMKSVEQ